MKEKIIVGNGLIESEFLRSLARNGINAFGIRVMSYKDFALEVLQRAGIFLDRMPSCKMQRACLIFNEMKDNSYFKNSRLRDAECFIDSIDELRINYPGEIDINTLCGGEFEEKNEAIINIYNIYLSKMINAGLIDDIQIIYEAIKEEEKINAEVCFLKGFEPKPLEKTLLDKCTNGYSEFSLYDDKPLEVCEFSKAYGISNEIEHVLDYIYKNNIPLDKCVIACSEKNLYSEEIEDILSIYNIPYSLGISKSVQCTNPGRVLSSLLDWQKDYASSKSLEKLFSSSAFDSDKLFERIGLSDSRDIRLFIKMIGNLKLTFNNLLNDKLYDDLQLAINSDAITANIEEKKRILPAIEEFIKELNKDLRYFVGEYSIIRDGVNPSDERALSEICNFLGYSMAFHVSTEYILDEIFNISIGSSTSCEGMIHITSYEKLKNTLRPYVFIVGLSANYFPGKPKEDHILLDSDFRLFEIGVEIPMSNKRIIDRIKNLDDTISLLRECNSNIFMSYSYFNSGELKDQTASSYMFKKYKEINGDTSFDEFLKGLREVTYFESPFSNNYELGKKILEGTPGKGIKEILNRKEFKGIDFSKKRFSATAIETFFKCRYLFYLESILGLSEEYTEDPTDIISPSDRGTLVHAVLERCDLKNIDLDRFGEIADAAFNAYIKEKPPISKTIVYDEELNFLKICTNAYLLASNDSKTIMKEDDIEAKHDNGIIIHGHPDAIIVMDDGERRVVDYKAKSRIEHNPNDLKSIIQAMVYAYIMIKSGEDIDSCEFRYLRQNRHIVIKDIKGKMGAFDDLMNLFKDSLEKGDFEPCDAKSDAEPCVYCKFHSLCPKYLVSKEDE